MGCSQKLGESETVGDDKTESVSLMLVIIVLRDIRDDIRPRHVPTQGSPAHMSRITCHGATQ